MPYQLEIRLYQYSNPSHKLSDGSCCHGCTRDCNTVLWLCLFMGGTSQVDLDCNSRLTVLGNTKPSLSNAATITDAVGDDDNFIVKKAVDILSEVCLCTTPSSHALHSWMECSSLNCTCMHACTLQTLIDSIYPFILYIYRVDIN